jgi:hypothetical protein
MATAIEHLEKKAEANRDNAGILRSKVRGLREDAADHERRALLLEEEACELDSAAAELRRARMPTAGVFFVASAGISDQPPAPPPHQPA